MRLFILKIFLCLSGLFFGLAFLTETALLQNAPPKPSPTKARRSATPRPKKTVAPANTRIEVETVDIDGVVIDEPVGNVIANVSSPPPPPANSTLRGRVFYADTGRAVKRAPIMLMRDKGFLGGGPGGTPTALTDGDGNFQMKNVQAGTYYAMVNAPGVVSPLAYVDISKMRPSAGESEEFEKAVEGFEKIVVDGITDADVQIPARRGGAIGGRVMYDNGDPAIGVKVEILRKEKDKFLPVIPNFGAFFAMFMGGGVFNTDDRGIYRFSGLPAGEYIVKITENTSHNESNERPGYGEMEVLFGGSANSLLSIFYPDAFESKAANIINVELGQEISEINLTIPSRSLHSVEGKIVSRKDKSPVKARISLKREGEEETYSIFTEMSRRSQNSQTDENGNWKFKDLPKGNYKLMIEPIQGESDYREEYLGESSSMNTNVTANVQKPQSPPKPKLAKKIQLIQIEDKDISEMVVELGSGATITGTVTVENNGEMPKSMTISAVNESNNEFTSSDTISSVYGGGARNATVKANDFRIENVVEGKTLFYIHQDEDYYVKSARAGGVDLLSAAALDLKDGETISNVQIILSKETGTLKGKIVDEKNEPLKNAEFLLVPTDAAKQKNTSFYRGVKANEKGEFEKKLPPGEYAVILAEPNVSPRKFEEFFKWLGDAVKDAQKVSVDAGETENLTVKKIKK